MSRTKKNTRAPLGILIIAIIMIALSWALSRLTELPALSDARYHDPSLPIEERIDDLMKHMTLREKIGQMALVEKNSLPLEDVAAYGIGGVLSGAGGKPAENTVQGWRAMIDAYTNASRASRTGIPILYGVDANHGHGNVPGATIFPHQIGLGAANDVTLTEEVARATATEARATGVTWVYAPSVDLPNDIRWGRVYEAYSDDPARTAALAEATVRGLSREGVVATPKHFVGLGSMVWGTSQNPDFSIDQGRTPIDDQMLRNTYLPPFKRVIDAGAGSVMVGLNSWGENQTAANRYLITEVLKHELGFSGIVVSDWYGVYAISKNKYDAVVQAINAGIDMVMLPYEYNLFIADVERAVYRGDITEARIDDAVRRILRVKFSSGMFEGTIEEQPLSVVGSDAHRSLARTAAARSAVILKNTDVLPIRGVESIYVAGSAADNIGIQSGAWTVEWQGIDGNWLPGATSILAGIREAAADAEVDFRVDGRFNESSIADLGIAIVGEKPYAEGWGDSADPRLTDADREAIEHLRKSVRKLLVVIVSGRPLIITDELPKWDALVAVWLPGSEGAGVADALFGTTETGTLPLPWPRSLQQLPFTNEEAADHTQPLFPRGFGIDIR